MEIILFGDFDIWYMFKTSLSEFIDISLQFPW